MSSKIRLIDAEHVFDLVWFERSQGMRQLGDLDALTLPVEAESSGACSNTRVQVHGIRKQPELRADSQRGVVAVQLADAADGVRGASHGHQDIVERARCP
jgi:hypothetical protein